MLLAFGGGHYTKVATIIGGGDILTRLVLKWGVDFN